MIYRHLLYTHLLGRSPFLVIVDRNHPGRLHSFAVGLSRKDSAERRMHDCAAGRGNVDGEEGSVSRVVKGPEHSIYFVSTSSC